MDVGVDVGGTFTDFVGFRGRTVVTTKVPSSRDPSRAVTASSAIVNQATAATVAIDAVRVADHVRTGRGHSISAAAAHANSRNTSK